MSFGRSDDRIIDLYSLAVQRADERARSCLARGTTGVGTGAAHVLLDGIDLRNTRNGFSGDRRIAALGDHEELAPQMAPAEGNGDAIRWQLLVRGVAIALDDAAINCEQLLKMLAAARPVA